MKQTDLANTWFLIFRLNSWKSQEGGFPKIDNCVTWMAAEKNSWLVLQLSACESARGDILLRKLDQNQKYFFHLNDNWKHDRTG